MAQVVFTTPGLIDIRSFTTMGMSAKPATANPIGYFGTGLKYAVATLVRLGAEPVVWIGRDRYTFTKSPVDFRGKQFEQLRMKREKWSLTRATWHDLPFTTEYGRNWKPWQAFRELEANTRDENGVTELLADDVPIEGADGTTTITVSEPGFTEAYNDRNNIFLPDADPLTKGSIQILPKPSKHLYYRGLRVADLSKPTLNTYNFIQYMELTEDRTLKYEFLAQNALGTYIVTSDSEQLIEQIITAGDEYWEHSVQPPDGVAPSRAFHDVMMRHPKNVRGPFYGYYTRYDERPAVRERSLWDVHPLPWTVDGDQVKDAKDVPVMDVPYRYVGRWSIVANKIVDMVNAQYQQPQAPMQLTHIALVNDPPDPNCQISTSLDDIQVPF